MPDTLQRGLAVQIAETLRERILGGQIPSGTRINEVEIARELNISRGPLREAIRYLVSEGLLVHRPNKGAVVFEAQPDEVVALFELRSALETAAARLAAVRRDRKDVTALRRACERSRKTLAAGRQLVHHTDLDFHGALLQAARSPRITEQVSRVHQQIIVIRSRHNVAASHTDASLADHEELAEAIAEGQADRAAELMAHHLDRVRLQMITAMTGTGA
ncbi:MULTISPECIES: GntR family transcriptional regulator [unclassified Streptomyces]|uniref:GntR family transcriptional regulator n=1 Tax=unclassified Streptomyces TaxID=2593676 RepID=UPI000C278200|nr:GntR family transcriptional regulator [Streptomyces sp. CB02959]PJN38396.1 GntR family transcriptional regulator [Streptomyces sp. CB02959]